LLLRRFALFGFQSLAVIGGATAMIGDPSGKSQERNLLSQEQLKNNIKGISKQLSSLINQQEFSDLNPLDLIRDFKILNNHDYQHLEMVFKSINPNAQYKDSLITILKELPLPLQELNLSEQDLTELYQGLNLNVNYLKQQAKLADLNFHQLLKYLNT